MRTSKLLGALIMLVGAINVSVSAQVSVACPSLPCTITVTGPAVPPPPPPPPTTKFPVGARVVVSPTATGGTYVRTTSSSTSAILGTQPIGATGVIVSGPVIDATDKLARWNVNYDTGADGWTAEKFLNASTAPPIVVVHGVQLSWGAVSTAVSYSLYRSEVQGGPYGPNTSAPVMGTSYLDPSAVSGKTYYYVVQAVDSQGRHSANSNEVKVVFP